MIHKLLAFLLLFTFGAGSDSFIDKADPLSYFRAAEDFAAKGTLTDKDIAEIRHLYVIAAVLDPSLRENSILGLIEIEKDSTFISMLHAMRGDNQQLLVPQVIIHKDSSKFRQKHDPSELCNTISAIRNGKKVNAQDIQGLRPWRYLFPKIYDRAINSTKPKKITSKSEIVTTIKVELAILGGPSVWSADYVNSDGRPVSFTLSDDLATLFKIDPTKVIRKNGRWVAE